MRLSTKVIGSTGIFAFIVTLTFVVSLKEMVQNAFFESETKKAELVVKTIEPTIALNLYLGFEDKLLKTLETTMRNSDILRIEVISLEDDIILKKEHTRENKADIENSIKIRSPLYIGDNQENIGFLKLYYSASDLFSVKSSFDNYIYLMLLLLFVFLFLLALLLHYLHAPLRKITDSLTNYKIGDTLDLKIKKSSDEIGLIALSVVNMSKKINDFTTQLQNSNTFLEEKVKEKTAELRNQLYSDDLTSLPNRKKIILDLVRMKHKNISLINIDDFKEINNLYGHRAGDKILKSFSKVLLRVVENHPITVYSMGADEFACVYNKDEFEPMYLHELMTRIIYQIQNSFVSYKNQEIDVRVSVGIAVEDENTTGKANIALNRSRELKRQIVMYERNMGIEEMYRENIERLNELKEALEHDRIVPYFQPIVRIKDKKTTKYEALIRLIKPNNEVVAPYYFLELAKKSRLYSSLTAIMIEKSLKVVLDTSYEISINLSLQDILDGDTMNYLKETLERYGIAERVTLEILESEGIENYEEVSHFIRDIKTLGCKIAIDDFGTGYSNFDHLIHLNIDYLKLDGSIVKNIDTDENSRIIVETMVEFSKKLGIETIAEFVHSEDVLNTLEEIGVDFAQGYHLGKPSSELL